MELSVIIINGWKPLTIITKSSILDVAAVLKIRLCIWSRYENNDLCFHVKNCINIDLKCLIGLASPMEFPKLFELLTQKLKKQYLKLFAL